VCRFATASRGKIEEMEFYGQRVYDVVEWSEGENESSQALSGDMQRHTSHSVTSYISSTTYLPAAAAAGDDEARTSVGDTSIVSTRSAWAISASRHTGKLNFTIQ